MSLLSRVKAWLSDGDTYETPPAPPRPGIDVVAATTDYDERMNAQWRADSEARIRRQQALSTLSVASVPMMPQTSVPMMPPIGVPVGLTNGHLIPHTPGTRNHSGAAPVSSSAAALHEVTAKPSKAISVMVRAFNRRRVPFIWGPPGIGKSQAVKRAAAEWYAAMTGGTVTPQGSVLDANGNLVHPRRYFRDIRAVLLDPVDLRGLPTVRDGVTKWAPPGFMPQDGCEPCVVFFDELNRAPGLVQNACLSLMLDRHLGEYVLPDNVVLVAAGNRESDGGGVTKLNAALSMRFTHVNMVADLKDWSEWAILNDVHPLVIAFLRYRPNLLCDFQKDARTSPNPRSWEFVSDLEKDNPDKEEARIMVTGTVGTAATEYLAFAEMYKALPSIDAILLDPKNAKVPGNDRVDVLFAVAAALAHRADHKNIGRILTYLARVPREYMIYSVQDMTRRNPDLTQTPEFGRFVIDNADIVG